MVAQKAGQGCTLANSGTQNSNKRGKIEPMAKFTGVRTQRGSTRITIIFGTRTKTFQFKQDDSIETQKEASQLRKEIYSDLADGSVSFHKIQETYFGKVINKAPRGSGTLHDVLENWIEYCKPYRNKRKGYKGKTLNLIKQTIENKFIPELGRKRLKNITYQDLFDYYHSPEFAHLDPKSFQNWNGYLVRMFKHAFIHMNIKCAPFPTDNMIYPEARIDPALKVIFPYAPEEVEALIKYIIEHFSIDIQLYFVLFRGLGIRPCESLALEETDIEGDYIHVTKGMVENEIVPPKNWKSREVYVQPQVMEVLQKYLAIKKKYNPVFHRSVTKIEKKAIPLFQAGKTRYLFENGQRKHHVNMRRFNRAWTEAHRAVRLDKATAEKLYITNKRELLALDAEALANDERLTPYLKQQIPQRDAYKLRHTRASELISSGAADEGPFELGHDPKMFFDIYAKQIQAYKKKEHESERRKKLTSVVKIS